MSTLQISASLLSADCARLGEEAVKVINAGADLIHLDVMDNHYVPNLTFGPLICQALRQYGISSPLDVHLMVKPVDRLIVAFAQAGASIITFHPEASEHIDRSLQLIRDNGCRAGLVFNPATPLDYLKYVLDKLDQVLIMSVNPGFGGQTFIPETLNKIAEAQQIITKAKHPIQLAVDGGIKIDNIRQVAEAGADTFVIGSALFANKDYTNTIKHLRAELANVNKARRFGFRKKS